MREYGQVQCSFWADQEVQGLSDQAKLLAVYLLTGPHSNGIGCFRLPDGYVQADFGWDAETVSKGFLELFRMGFCKRCETTRFVLLPKFLKWNPVSNANVAKARQKEFAVVSKNSLIHGELAASLLAFGNHWEKGFETLLKGYAKQDPEPTLSEPTRREDNAPRRDRHAGDLVPTDWQPDEITLARLRMAGVTAEPIPDQVQAFIAHYRAQERHINSENQITELFTKWMLREKTYGKAHQGRQPRKLSPAEQCLEDGRRLAADGKLRL